jgi:hypothetical protein
MQPASPAPAGVAPGIGRQLGTARAEAANLVFRSQSWKPVDDPSERPLTATGRDGKVACMSKRVDRHGAPGPYGVRYLAAFGRQLNQRG